MAQTLREISRSHSFILYTLIGCCTIFVCSLLGFCPSPAEIPFFANTPLFYNFAVLSPKLSQTLNFLLIIFLAGLFHKMNAHFGIGGVRSYWPFFFFILLFSAHAGITYLSPATIACIAFIPLLFLLFQSYQTNKSSEYGYTIGLFLSLIVLYWHTAIYYVPILLIGMWMMRSLNIRSFLALILGIITPIWLQFAFFYGIDNLTQFITKYEAIWQIDIFLLDQNLIQTIKSFPITQVVNWMLSIAITLAITLSTLRQSILDKVRTQGILHFLILLNIASTAFLLLDIDFYFGHIAVVRMTQAALLAYYFMKATNKTVNFIFILLVGAFLSITTYSIWIN